MKLVQVGIFDSLIDVHLVKSKLESGGIQCVLLDENQVILGTPPSTNGEVGAGVKLLVKEEDVADALEVIKVVEQNWKERNKVRCPACNSESVFRLKKDIFTRFKAYFLGHTFYRCNDCRKEFKVQRK